MKATAIIGANYGDEGKGLMTDYICAREGADLVVRFNGGAQAGHTVVTPDGKRHVFHTYGSGTFCNVPTYLSQFFIFNPIMWQKELDDLGFCSDYMWMHPMCIITTPYDMLLNQAAEAARGVGRHGSCGVGIYETVLRSKKLPLYFFQKHFASTVREIRRDYIPARLRELGLPERALEDEYDLMRLDQDFYEAIAHARNKIGSCTLSQCARLLDAKHICFEGAQGLLLDKDAPGFPYLTPSKTGLHNVRILCDEIQMPLENLTAIYVSRTYLTRHGAGRLEGEMERPDWLQDDTNLDSNPWQQRLRYAPLDPDDLYLRVLNDSVDRETPGSVEFAFTHADQHGIPWHHGIPRYIASGPTRDHIKNLHHDSS